MTSIQFLSAISLTIPGTRSITIFLMRKTVIDRCIVHVQWTEIDENAINFLGISPSVDSLAVAEGLKDCVCQW